MVKDAYLRMKLSNNCKRKELLSIWNGVLWCYKDSILTSEERNIQLNKKMQHSPPMLTFMQAVLCSSLQLWIAVLTELTDSVWQLVISRQRTSKHDLCAALKSLYQAHVGPQQCSGLSASCLRGLMSTKRSSTTVDVGVGVWGRGVKPTHTNEKQPSVFGLHHPT